MIRVQDLHVRYGQQAVLRGLSLQIRPGEFVLLTGPSGCGKSTLAYCLNGLIPHTFPARVEGSVVVGGLDTRQHPVHRLAQEVGLVLQLPETQIFNLRVEEEVAFGPRNLGLAGEEVQRRLRWALEATGLCGYERRRIITLSGGEKQRLVLAAVLAMRPRALVLDEPLTNLDAEGTSTVLQTLDELRRQGTAILLIEHKTCWVAPLADRVVVMGAGQVLLEGAVSSVARQEELLASLGVRPLFPSEAEDPGFPLSAGEREPAVLVEDVHLSYEGRPVLRGVSMALPRGEFAALVGPNGAGKSTLARMIVGLQRPSRGRIRLAGRDSPPPTASKGLRALLRLLLGGDRMAWGRDIGLLLQNPLEQLFCDTVEEEVAFGLTNYGLPVDGVLEQVLAGTGLDHVRQAQVARLSAGEKQRLALAAILALSPQVLLLDEPTLGQDWGHLTRLMAIVAELNRRGSTILLISHDVEIVRRYARLVFCLEEGRMQEEKSNKR